MGLSKEQLNLIHTKEPIDYEIYELIYLINKTEFKKYLYEFISLL